MNLRPPGPQPGALPDCATPRDGTQSTRVSVRPQCKRAFVDSGSERRRCGDCGAMKPLREFAWRRRELGQLDSLCPTCRAAYKQRHYAANRERYVEQARRRKQDQALARTSYLLAYFRNHPCVDCGETDAIVLEFDHRDKRFNIGAALPYRNWASILAEIEKCDVVCANCHRRRTAQRRGSLRLLLTADEAGAA